MTTNLITKAKSLRNDTNLLIGTFGLTRTKQSPRLSDLLDTTTVEPIPEIETARLEKHRQRLDIEGDFWNEEELKMRFLSVIFEIVDFDDTDKIKLFYERALMNIVQEHKLSVVVDCLLATPFGIGEPAAPYFFLQEFKRQKNDNDAEGQMLAAMLIAQARNANNKPVYGCNIQGKYWTFSILHGKEYSVSLSLDATKPSDLIQIVQVLRRLKATILAQLA